MHTSSRDLPTLYVLVSYIEVVCCAILEIDSCAVETRITKFLTMMKANAIMM